MSSGTRRPRPRIVATKTIAAPGFDSADRIQLNGEYGGGSTSAERGWHLRWQTQELRRHARNAGYSNDLDPQRWNVPV